MKEEHQGKGTIPERRARNGENMRALDSWPAIRDWVMQPPKEQ